MFGLRVDMAAAMQLGRHRGRVLFVVFVVPSVDAWAAVNWTCCSPRVAQDRAALSEPNHGK